MKINVTKVLKTTCTVLEIVGAIGGIGTAGFEISDGIKRLNNSKKEDIVESVASTVTEVEA